MENLTALGMTGIARHTYAHHTNECNQVFHSYLNETKKDDINSYN